MNLHRTSSFAVVATLAGAFLTLPSNASQGDFYRAYTHAKVIAHVVLSGPSAQEMFLQQSGRKQYLYVQQSSKQGFTIVDVSKPGKPKVVNRVPQQNLAFVTSGMAVVEQPDHSASKLSNKRGDDDNPPQSIRIVDVSDPAHPQIVQSFQGVTGVLPDTARGLIFVANGEGIWILSHQQILRRHSCSSSDAISSAIPNCD